MRHTVVSLKKNDFLVRTVDDVEPILERNKILRAEPQQCDWNRQVASVPAVTLVDWLNEELARGHEIRPFSPEFYEMVYKKLQDPDWVFLRVDK